MSDAIIVLNAGSSSLKFSIYRVARQELDLVAGGQIERLGNSPRFSARDRDGNILARADLHHHGPTLSHAEAFHHLSDWMEKVYGARLSAVAVGHRVVHGGSGFGRPTLINDAVLTALEQLIPLAPLHQPHNLAVIRAVMEVRPGLTQVACFDTAFHHGRPSVTVRMGLPDDMFRSGIRRWGFHGLSYEFIAREFRRQAPATAAGRVIAAHLGSGASLCAMHNGRCVDTTMGFSALDGLPMATRCGSLDPGVILYLLRQGRDAGWIEDLLYRKSGLLGISGVSGDLRELLTSHHPLAAEAVDFFVHRIVREIGALTAALGGLDALVFTAGIGENSPVIRDRVCRGLTWLGIAVDAEANRRGIGCISPEKQHPSVWVIPANEEHVIAEHTLAVVRSGAVS